MNSTRVSPKSAAPSKQPLTGGAPHEVGRQGVLDPESGEPLVELQPRVVGPGRKERGYLERQAELLRELELARLVERGSERLLDRLETELEIERSRQKRLCLALGAMQREVETLRRQAALPEAQDAQRVRSGWRRLFSRRAVRP